MKAGRVALVAVAMMCVGGIAWAADPTLENVDE